MGRPIEDGSRGAWSVRQAAEVTGLSARQVRWLLAHSPAVSEPLTDRALLGLRVAHALREWPPSPLEVDPVLVEERDRGAVAAAGECWSADCPPWQLLVDPLNARIVRSPAALVSWLEVSTDVPFLVLPLGVWGLQVRAQITERRLMVGAA